MSSDDRKKEPGQAGDEPPAEEKVQESGEDQTVSPASVPESGALEATSPAPVPEENLAAASNVSEPEPTDDKPDETAETETSADETEAQEPPAAVAPPARSDGFARFVAVIALLVAAGGVALSQFPQVPSGSAARLASLTDRVSAVEGSGPAPAATSDSSAEIQALQDRIAATDERVNNLSLLIDEIRTVQATAAANPPASESAAAAPAVTMDQIAELTGRIHDLAQRVEAQEQAPAPAETPPAAPASDAVLADVAALKGELDALKSEIGRLEQAQTGLSSRVANDVSSVRTELSAELEDRAAALAGRIDEVASTAQKSLDAGNSRVASRAALVLAAGRLRDAANTGEPYAGAWNAVTALGVAPGEHEAIAANAATGVPTMAAIQAGFADAASAAIVADQVGTGEGWMDGALRRMGSLVSIRRTGNLEGDSTEAVLARAEQKLQSNELAAALAELAVLTEAPAKAMQSWLDGARRRQALDQAIDALQTSLLDAPGKQG